MSEIAYDYFYGNEAEQFSFYRIPKALFIGEQFANVSAEAKVLYGILLDRMSLSMKNGWLDEDNRVYIYFKQEDAAEMLGCGRDKAMKLFAELDISGIGLIERKKRGQGKPPRIYIKNFIVHEGPSCPAPKFEKSEFPTSQTVANSENYQQVSRSDHEKSEIPTSQTVENSENFQQMGFSDLEKSEKPTSGSRNNRHQEVGNFDLLYRMNNTELSDTELNSSSSTFVSVENREDDEVEKLKVQMEYDYFVEEMPDKLPFVDSVVEILRAIIHAHDESHHELIAKIDSCVVLEFLDLVRGLDFCGVRNFSAYLRTVFIDFITKREVELALIG